MDKPDVTEFEISRKEWLRGEGSDNSYLYRLADEKKCCLGIGALACGYKLDEIMEERTPYDLDAELGLRGFFTRLMNYEDRGPTTFCSRLMAVNDDPAITDQVREEQLTEMFACIGVKVTFTE